MPSPPVLWPAKPSRIRPAGQVTRWSPRVCWRSLLSLTGFAVGRNGAALAGVVTAVLLVAGGLGWLFVEHRRARAKLVGAAPERPEDAAPLS